MRSNGSWIYRRAAKEQINRILILIGAKFRWWQPIWQMNTHDVDGTIEGREERVSKVESPPMFYPIPLDVVQSGSLIVDPAAFCGNNHDLSR
jgi:hypothetical protein